jgi:hypothetical protein
MQRDPIREVRLSEAKVRLHELLLDLHIGDFSDSEIQLLYWLDRDPVIRDYRDRGRKSDG